MLCNEHSPTIQPVAVMATGREGGACSVGDRVGQPESVGACVKPEVSLLGDGDFRWRRDRSGIPLALNSAGAILESRTVQKHGSGVALHAFVE